MTFTDAAAEVLRLVGKPLHYKEITDIAIEKNLLSHVGKSPEVTMGARLAAMLKKDTADNTLVRVKPGVFALREWDDKTIKAAMEPKRGSRKSTRPEAPKARSKDEGAEAGGGDDDSMSVEVEAIDGDAGYVADGDAGTEAEADIGTVTGAPGPRPPDDVDDDEDDEVLIGGGPETPTAKPSSPRAPAASFRSESDAPRSPPEPDELMRAEAVARAGELFDEEDDDDQPILGGDDRATEGAGEGADGRRRRRRRRRGRGPETAGATPAASGGGNGGLPTYTATPVVEGRRDAEQPRREGGREGGRDRDRDNSRGRDEARVRDEAGEAAYRGPQVIELSGGEGHMLDDLAGRDLSDAIVAILSTFDRNAGAVSLRQIAETAQRRGRLAGDPQGVQSQIAAAVRADNQRRLAAGQRPRFRLAGGRVALTDWLLGGDLARLEQEALAAVERYRDAARRAFARKVGELPGHAFVEVCVLLLERMGIGQIRAVRRPGAPAGESHFTAVLRAAGDEIRIAIVIRRDGRELGRERVVELRGSLHHYGPAAMGWIFTAGQLLSGARDEASVPGTPPIGLHDGLTIARLCDENDVAVIRARLPIAIPDVDLLEALRAS